MKVWIATASTRPGARAWAVALVTAMLTTAIGWSVFAQAPPAPKAQPKAQPKAPPQQAQAPAPAPAANAKPGGAPEVPPLTYTQWTKVCLKGQEANAQQVCFTGKEGRIDTGMLVIGAVLIEPEGAPNKVLRVTLPLGMQLPPGTRAIVDGGQPMTAPYLVCFPNGCMADYEASGELIGKLKQGKNLMVQAINSQGQGVSLPVPLPDFAKAYDGPPTDPKIVEDRQKKLEEEFIKKQQALQQQQQQAAPK
jgi:invasion protein IalB